MTSRASTRVSYGGEHVVYRVYDADERLLYIGATGDIQNRLRVHGYQSPWYVQAARVDIEAFPDRPTAFAAEAYAIREESPLHNVRSKVGAA